MRIKKYGTVKKKRGVYIDFHVLNSKYRSTPISKIKESKIKVLKNIVMIRGYPDNFK